MCIPYSMGGIKVIRKIRRLGGEKGQFWHNKASKCVTGNEILQNKRAGTQTSFFPPILVVY